jgi:hypothetical protein
MENTAPPLSRESVDGTYNPDRLTIVRWGDHFFLQTRTGWSLVQAQDADGSGRPGETGVLDD